MTDIRDRLRDADPLLIDPGLSRDDVASMRRAVMREAAQAPQRETGLHWKKMLPLAAAVAVIAGAGIDAARRTSRQAPLPAAAVASPVTAGTKTQVHFSTPGGTRIIWTIDPAFTLTENR